MEKQSELSKLNVVSEAKYPESGCKSYKKNGHQMVKHGVGVGAMTKNFLKAMNMIGKVKCKCDQRLTESHIKEHWGWKVEVKRIWKRRLKLNKLPLAYRNWDYKLIKALEEWTSPENNGR